MNTSLLSLGKKHATSLLLAVGLATYVVVAGMTNSCSTCAAITNFAGLPSIASTALAKQPSAAGVPQPAPAWELRDLEGNPVKSADFAGKVVVLNFWATWCPPCRAEIPHFVDLQKKYADKGLVFVGVSLDKKGPDAVKRFAAKFRINYPLVMGDQKILDSFGGVRSIPATFIIDRAGNVVIHHVGYGSESFFESAIQPLL